MPSVNGVPNNSPEASRPRCPLEAIITNATDEAFEKMLRHFLYRFQHHLRVRDAGPGADPSMPMLASGMEEAPKASTRHLWQPRSVPREVRVAEARVAAEAEYSQGLALDNWHYPEATLYVRNMLLEVVRKLSPGDAVQPVYYLQRLAANASHEQFRRYINRDSSVLFNSPYEFAVILIQPGKEPLHDKWGEAFKIAYGRTAHEGAYNVLPN
ncbi:hypothetical protein FQN49_002721 [Arthroderma sp. PD_2]|nr:hypothetical protein FQN49_002721 [Arthroderma sp. PD_2]